MEAHYAQQWVRLIPGLRGAAGAGATRVAFHTPVPLKGRIRDFAPGFEGVPSSEPSYGPGPIGDLARTFADDMQDTENNGAPGSQTPVPPLRSTAAEEYHRARRDAYLRESSRRFHERLNEARLRVPEVPAAAYFEAPTEQPSAVGLAEAYRTARRQEERRRREEEPPSTRARSQEPPGVFAARPPREGDSYNWGPPNHRRRRVGRGLSPDRERAGHEESSGRRKRQHT